eukprot:358237-Chlamydomonas_euryale.AAC.3
MPYQSQKHPKPTQTSLNQPEPLCLLLPAGRQRLARRRSSPGVARRRRVQVRADAAERAGRKPQQAAGVGQHTR